MIFDISQSSYVDLRETLKQRTSPIVVFCGAGLSQPAGLPSWRSFKERLLRAGDEKLSRMQSMEVHREKAKLDLARAEKNSWLAMKHIRDVLGPTTYAAGIRDAIGKAGKCEPPKNYHRFWELGIAGIVTLNLDRFAGRSYADVFRGRPLREFQGIDCHRHSDLFVSGTPFALNLHGIVDDVDSWILTQDDRDRLVSLTAYKGLMDSLFTTQTVVFAGISADDEAISFHLDRLKRTGFRGGRHFWITDRNDNFTSQWAEDNQIRVIIYESKGEHHSAFDAILEDVSAYVPRDTTPPPVYPSTPRIRGNELPPPGSLERLTGEEIRQALNNEASRILNSNDQEKKERYEKFWTEYEEAIYRAWSVSFQQGRNSFMGLIVKRPLQKGGFGTIYEAYDSNGTKLALKVLHSSSRGDRATLEAFRRGVRAMRILSARNVTGMVPYKSAWEIPPSAVMEFIEGPNLAEAVEAGMVDSWGTRVKIGINLTKIIRNAHSVPERVLHRDIRPPNIMLSHFWENPGSTEVVVLDFDLSWHREASGASVMLSNSMNGYLAPEQINQTSADGRTRNALVDSYGIGMTLYFLATKQNPMVGESLYGTWMQTLDERVGKQTCETWKSLPKRYARMIACSTRANQSERWDLPRIQGELTLLDEALSSANKVRSADLLAEEILSRASVKYGGYRWDVDRSIGSIEMRSGFTLSVTGEESNKRIVIVLEWMNTGDRKFENVKKYIGSARDRACSSLRRSGWHIATGGVTLATVRVVAECEVSRVEDPRRIDAVAEGVTEAIEALRLGSV